ncbi:glycosyltransferase [Actinomycetospora soli]|uniref:glycosyltransferase n=1 Tax=Actinomycetospora soli TaxID=2893887 RepID=UPI001E35BD42|nr:glycosyltransferase [Actinomycetospora soli]MCD2187289.1 glycosyltransferase [Actinomycetospora soli]
MLTTVTGSPSHARAVLPFARVVAEAGHEVVVACPPDLAATFDREPVTVAPVLVPMSEAAARFVPRIEALGEDPDPAAVVARVFAGEHLVDEVRALRGLGRVDLVLRDGGEFAGMLYAEELGVPHLPAPSGAAHVLDPLHVGPLLTASRTELGLPAVPDAGAPAPFGRLDCMPPTFSFAPPWLPDAFAYRQDDEVERGGRLPEWVAALPAGRPLVLGSLGTALPMMQASGRSAPGGPPADPAAGLRALVRGANAVDAEVVVATGGLECDVEPAPHVHLERWVPQPLLLQVADAMITHGGYNTVREAVRHGVPMVAFPQFGDQFASAGRIAALGLGRHVDGASVAEGLAAVLDDGSVRGAVRAAQRAMLALPPVAEFVHRAEALVG